MIAATDRHAKSVSLKLMALINLVNKKCINKYKREINDGIDDGAAGGSETNNMTVAAAANKESEEQWQLEALWQLSFTLSIGNFNYNSAEVV